MKHHGMTALVLSFVLITPAAGDDDNTLPAGPTSSETQLTDRGEIEGGADLVRLLLPGHRLIDDLDWHTDYSEAYRQAQDERKMLFIFFRDESSPRIADIYESDVLSSEELADSLSNVVRVVLPVDAMRPFRVPERPDLAILSHTSFKYMYGRPGIAMIDLTDPDSDLHGLVVSAHPFSAGRMYTVRATKIVLGLPRGTVTQRALIYAVRLHPAAPVSTTAGQCHGYLCKQARHSSHLMATYGSVGHHDWGTRYGEIASRTGRAAMEVAAMSGNQSLIEASIELVNQWYGSPAHWQIMSTPAAIFGYDLVRDATGNWWGTGLFAN